MVSFQFKAVLEPKGTPVDRAWTRVCTYTQKARLSGQQSQHFNYIAVHETILK